MTICWVTMCETMCTLFNLYLCEVEVLVTQSCLTLGNPTDCSLPGSSVHGIRQARILEWVAISFSRGSSQPRDRTCILHWQADSLLSEPPGGSTSVKEVVLSSPFYRCSNWGLETLHSLLKERNQSQGYLLPLPAGLGVLDRLKQANEKRKLRKAEKTNKPKISLGWSHALATMFQEGLVQQVPQCTLQPVSEDALSPTPSESVLRSEHLNPVQKLAAAHWVWIQVIRTSM